MSLYCTIHVAENKSSCCPWCGFSSIALKKKWSSFCLYAVNKSTTKFFCLCVAMPCVYVTRGVND